MHRRALVRPLKLLLLSLLLRRRPGTSCTRHDIDDYGATPGCVPCAPQNGRAFFDAARAATVGDSVWIKAGKTYWFRPRFNATLKGLRNVTFQIQGALVLDTNYSAWPMLPDDETVFAPAIDIQASAAITIRGNGTIDGQGQVWWWAFFRHRVGRRRPTLLNIEDTVDVDVSHLALRNSPRFHVYASNVTRASFHDLDIRVDLRGGSSALPMFPYNTDGIDVSGRFIHIFDVRVENYDDAVAVKPLSGGVCTQDVLVERVSVKRGVGLSVGSVGPKRGGECVRGVVFRNCTVTAPFKLVYIKTGTHEPDTEAWGIVENVTYAHINASAPWFWPVYVGPQQQSEPDGTGQGWWPAPDPRVTVRDIYLKHIHVTRNRFRAGVLRCDPSTNPCGPIHFKDVTVVGGFGGYYCDGVFGSVDSSSEPQRFSTSCPFSTNNTTLGLTTHS